METRHTDPVTGGQKGEKPEDYSQVPPVPLGMTLSVLEGSRRGVVLLHQPRVHLVRFLVEGDRHELVKAAAAAIVAMDGLVGADAVARVYFNGAKSYAPGNWCLGFRWRLSIAAGWRHLIAHEFGYILNRQFIERTGQWVEEPHLAHFVFHCFTLYEYSRLGRGTDDALFFAARYGRTREEMVDAVRIALQKREAA